MDSRENWKHSSNIFPSSVNTYRCIELLNGNALITKKTDLISFSKPLQFVTSFFVVLTRILKLNMKRNLFIVICIAFVFSGCERQPIQSANQNPYSGTKWSKTQTVYTGDFLYVLSFTDGDYNYYTADVNGNFKNMVDAGTYTYSGNSITMSSNNQVNSTSGVNNRLRRATVSGNLMTVSYQTIYTNGGTYDYTINLMKN